jgi:threonine/homoserine/homoserine lactone efflux protein
LLLALPGAFEVIRYAGVAYLLFLGVKAWRADVAPVDVGDGSIAPGLSHLAVLRGGFLIGISNPKLILFAVAFLPQFVNPAKAQMPQFAILVGTFAVIEAFWYAVYALGGHSLSRYLNKPAVKRAFNRMTGAIFVGFGLALLKVKPA